MTDLATKTKPARLPSRTILGIKVCVASREEACAWLSERLVKRRFTRLTFLNAHNANVASVDPEFRAILDEFVVFADGVGVDIASRILYGAPFPANLNGTDFIPRFLEGEKRQLRLGLLGAKHENMQAARDKLAEKYPQHAFVFAENGFFASAEEPALLERLEAARPDLLLVAMGVPRQEMWVARNLTERHCSVPVGVGALFDFLSGAVPRAPLWMRRLRLEWLFRLGLEPRRLWRRYVVGNPVFLLRVLGQKLSRGAGPR